MKYSLLCISLLLASSCVNNSKAFDLENPRDKAKFCSETQWHNSKPIGYDEQKDVCVFLEKYNMKIEENARELYCNSVYGYPSYYSYPRNDCITKNELFLYGDSGKEMSNGQKIQKANHFHALSKIKKTDYENEDNIFVIEKEHQKKLQPIIKKFKDVLEKSDEKNAEKLGKYLIEYIEKKIKNTKSQDGENILFLLKYEIENLYLQKIHGCKGSYCRQKYNLSENDNYRQILKMKDGIEILLERKSFNETFGCYKGKTLFRKNGKETVIIDDSVVFDSYRSLCATEAQVRDDERVWLTLCTEDGAGSGECGAIVVEFNIETEKMSFVDSAYYSIYDAFSSLAREKQKEMYPKLIDENIRDMRKIFEKGKSDTNPSYEYTIDHLKKIREQNQKIRDYFKSAHDLEIEHIDGDDYVPLLDEFNL